MKKLTSELLERFSKPSIAVIKNKKSFFDQNEAHLEYVKKVNSKYITQPKRTKCKNCNSDLEGIDFISHNVPYVLCEKCNHLNGLHEDTDDFAYFLYSNDNGQNYSKNYLNNFESRVNDIYLPKALFLLEAVMPLLGKDEPLTLLDVGSGGGHFVNACQKVGINAKGLDPNEDLVALASEKLGPDKVSKCDLGDINKILIQSQTDVISLIGVLEHLQNPREAIKAFCQSGSSFLYLQVPLFSLAVLLEHVNQEIFPRQLNAGHTHLYTKESLDYLFNEFGLEPVAEWWFGTDMVDLFRQVSVKSNYQSKEREEIFLQRYFGDFLDDLQNVLDRNKKCSGVNMILRKKY